MKKIIGILMAVMMLFSCVSFVSAATTTSVGEVSKVSLGHLSTMVDGRQTRIGTYSVTVMWPDGGTKTYVKRGYCPWVVGDIVYVTGSKIEHAPMSYYVDTGHTGCDENYCVHIHQDGTFCAVGNYS